MNCASARNRLLAQADPADVPDQVSGHLAICTACSAWHSLLVQVDAVVLATPVPAAPAGLKKQLIEQFQPIITAPKPAPPAAKPIVKPASSVVVLAAGASAGDRLAKLWPVGAVAAAVLVGALGWVILGGNSEDGQIVGQPPRDPMLEKVVQAKVDLDTAGTAPERLKVLDRLATDIHEQATTLSMVTPGAEMESLASRYEKVVIAGLVETARLLTDEERKALLDQYRNKLGEAEHQASRSAANAPPGSAEHLRHIAQAAGEGKTRLERMRQGGA